MSRCLETYFLSETMRREGRGRNSFYTNHMIMLLCISLCVQCVLLIPWVGGVGPLFDTGETHHTYLRLKSFCKKIPATNIWDITPQFTTNHKLQCNISSDVIK